MSRQPARENHRGLWVAFFGPDGVGKSAVIDELKLLLGPTLGSITRFHFRPGFCRSAPERPPVTDPHGQAARGVLISIFKLVYWLVDCWWGYLAVIRPAVSRGHMVIFDRYYSDILVDPTRYRLPAGARWPARCLVRLAPRPDLCIILDAAAEVVQRRKQEVSLVEVQRQRGAYLAIFRPSRRNVIVNADSPISEVARRAAVAILSFLTNSNGHAFSVLIAGR
ncbi:MAG TPA: hypothetical protein VL240_10410 [Candidatus Binatia bacterium]|nr:hypothetical protein [Candidatus Binatia bacterium]